MNSQRNEKESDERPKESAVETYRISLPLAVMEAEGYSDLDNAWEPEEQSAKKNKNSESTIRRKRNLSVESAADAPARKKSQDEHLHLSSEEQDSILKTAEKTSSALALSTSAASGCSVFNAPKTEALDCTFEESAGKMFLGSELESLHSTCARYYSTAFMSPVNFISDSILKSPEKTSSALSLSTSAASGCSVFNAPKTEAQDCTFEESAGKMFLGSELESLHSTCARYYSTAFMSPVNFISDLPHADLPIWKVSFTEKTELLKLFELLKKEFPEAEESLETIKSRLISLEADITPQINNINSINNEAKAFILNALKDFI